LSRKAQKGKGPHPTGKKGEEEVDKATIVEEK